MNSNLIKEIINPVPDYYVFISCMSEDYIRNHLKDIQRLNNVVGVYENEILYNFDKDDYSLKSKELSDTLPDNTIMEMDIDDGFVWRNIRYCIVNHDLKCVILGV